jgi:protein SCO1/2
VEAEKSRVTIRHEAIPGFMKAMTMPFTLKNPNDLDDVRPGDEIEAKLRVERQNGEVKDYALLDLVVSRPAPAQALTLNLSGERPEIIKASSVLKPGELVPDFAMVDQEGQAFKLSDLRGNVVALTFIFTGCPLPDFCPRMDRKFSEVADHVKAARGRAEHVRLVSVSFDPDHDTPSVLKSHATVLGASPPLWTFAVASHAELARVARPLGLVYGPGREGIIHNLVIAVIGPDGRLVRLETGEAARSWDTADLLKTMYSRLPRSK